MSKEQVSLRLPEHLMREIEAVQEAQGIDSRSEATRQVIRRGIDNARGQSAGEQIGQQATAVAGVGTLVAALGSGLTGSPLLAELMLPFGIATFMFAILWASVRVLDGREFR